MALVTSCRLLFPSSQTPPPPRIYLLFRFDLRLIPRQRCSIIEKGKDIYFLLLSEEGLRRPIFVGDVGRTTMIEG